MEVGLNLSDQYNCEISILHIYPVASRFSGEDNTDYLTPKLEKVQKHMIKLTEELRTEKRTKINNLVVSGNIEKQLLDFVNKQSYDLVIVGVNSTGEGNSPGSHTTAIIEKSQTPVLVIPNNYSLDG